MRTPHRMAVTAVAGLAVATATGLAVTACALPLLGRDRPHAGSMSCPTVDTINQLLGTSVDELQGGATNDDELSCMYLKSMFPIVTVYVSSDEDPEVFELGRRVGTFGGVVTDIPDFYDSAFTLTGSMLLAGTELQVLHGTVSVDITASATLDQEKALARLILDSLS